MNDAPLSFGTRLWFAWVCWLRVLFDGAFARRVWAVQDALPELPAPESPPETPAETPPSAPGDDGARADGALVLLGLLQREGRLVDFLQQDIASFEDDEVGAAARVVHEGCRRALAQNARIEPVRDEEEESRVRLEVGYDRSAIKLTGNVGPKPPYTGTLRHRGWRVAELTLPAPTEGHDVRVVAPAEVEL